jgi:2-keto-3-deoxy-L-rhamnonate aldolase RhmA
MEASFSRLVRQPGLRLGTYIGEFSTSALGPILKSANCEFAMVDMEHSGFTFETVKDLLRFLHGAGIPTMLRPPSKDYKDIARACDIGAQGVMPPMLDTPAQARAILEYMKYAPVGRRGIALGIAHDDYAPGPVVDKLDNANKRTAFVALIETATGVDNVEEIASIDGVDCLWIGHFDLTASLGIRGQFDHKDYLDAVARIRAAARANGKAMGRLAASVEDAVALHALGFEMLLYSGDVGLLQSGLSSGIREIRLRCEGAKRNKTGSSMGARP